jgi:hypothetical protein
MPTAPTSPGPGGRGRRPDRLRPPRPRHAPGGRRRPGQARSRASRAGPGRASRRPDAPRGGNPRADRRRPDQPGDRRASLPEQSHGQDPYQPHLRQDRIAGPRRCHRLRPPPQPRLTQGGQVRTSPPATQWTQGPHKQQNARTVPTIRGGSGALTRKKTAPAEHRAGPIRSYVPQGRLPRVTLAAMAPSGSLVRGRRMPRTIRKGEPARAGTPPCFYRAGAGSRLPRAPDPVSSPDAAAQDALGGRPV